jgi:hypothetical protein
MCFTTISAGRSYISHGHKLNHTYSCRGQLKCDGTRAETRFHLSAKFRLSAKWTSPFKSAGASVQSATGSRGTRISGSSAQYAMFRGRVKGTGYPLHSPVSLSLHLPCVTVCHHIATGVYHKAWYLESKENLGKVRVPRHAATTCNG